MARQRLLLGSRRRDLAPRSPAQREDPVPSPRVHERPRREGRIAVPDFSVPVSESACFWADCSAIRNCSASAANSRPLSSTGQSTTRRYKRQCTRAGNAATPVACPGVVYTIGPSTFAPKDTLQHRSHQRRRMGSWTHVKERRER